MRPAGRLAPRSAISSSIDLPVFRARSPIVSFRRSVAKGPGNKLLMVTLWAIVWRASPATKPVNPLRAPFDSPRISIGILTEPDVMLTMRPGTAQAPQPGLRVS